jgi:hypothetical protein
MTAAPARPWWKQLWDWLDFWSSLPKAKLVDEDGKREAKQKIASLTPQAVKYLVEAWIRQNDELARDLESVRSRGAALLAATGVITGVLTLLVPITASIHASLEPNSLVATALVILAGIAFVVLIYCALGTVVLAIRSQEVDFWGQAEMKAQGNQQLSDIEQEYAFSLYVTYTDNIERLKNPVGYLRQAQVYFRLLVFALAGLVVASVLTGALGASTAAQPGSAVTSLGLVRTQVEVQFR